MSNAINDEQDPPGEKGPGKRSLGLALARRKEMLEALHAKALERRQKEKAQKQSLVRQMSQLQARERRRTREIERDEAREVVRRLGTLVLDALIMGQDVGAPSLAVDWFSLQSEQQKLIQRVVKRGRAQGGMGAADLVSDPAGPLPVEGDIDIRLDDDAT